MSKKIIKVAAIKDKTEKGYQTIQCSVSNGFAVNSKPTYILSTPEAIKQNNIVVDMDITDLCAGMKTVVSKTTDTDDQGNVIELEFNWMEVQ